MSERIPGYSQPDMIALWKDFVQRTFQRTRFRTTFNGVTRTVFQDGVARLLVLDEYHGDLEVLVFQSRPGKAFHMGSQEIDVTYDSRSHGGRPTVKEVKLGVYHPGEKHHFVLVGCL
jgi:hypothetical protein